MNFLEQYLLDNQLNSYSGLFNVEDKFVEQTNVYKIKGIGASENSFIFLENKNTLKCEIPLLEGQKALFLTPKNSSFLAVNQLI